MCWWHFSYAWPHFPSGMKLSVVFPGIFDVVCPCQVWARSIDTHPVYDGPNAVPWYECDMPRPSQYLVLDRHESKSRGHLNKLSGLGHADLQSSNDTPDHAEHLNHWATLPHETHDHAEHLNHWATVTSWYTWSCRAPWPLGHSDLMIHMIM
jgi:hypothetical protein